MNELQWREVRYKIDSDKIHLISSSIFSDNLNAYTGDPILTAVEFQREIVNNVIKTVRARSEGRLIIHSHDWMAGGVITAYANATGLPILHTVHNVFTACLPLDLLGGISLGSISDRLYFTETCGKACIDCQATAIKNATMINFVGEKFLREVVEDYFLDRDLVPPSVRHEVKEKYAHGAARSIMNAPSSQMYPERCGALVRKYGPDDNVLDAKRENLVAFQNRTGLTVNPDALLYFWPSRLDPFQKGVDLLEQICVPFIMRHPEVQIAIVADGIGNDRTHVDILGGIAWNSGGRVTCEPFNEEISLLGYAAACDVFGASLYEPCGQIDQVGNLFGATATNRDTGGYHDKIREL
ncbi:MAG: glycogen/starch synthase, partial [Syntrophales bacterium]|nr:glycogen/starch synthase [Syntrophales bacterium]